MKNQALFSSKDKRKKFECCLLQFLFGTLRVKLACMNEQEELSHYLLSQPCWA